MNMPPEKYAAFMRIRESFITRLERERTELRGLFARVTAQPVEPGVIEELGRISHGLAGAAATFGFAPVSAAAAALYACVGGAGKRGWESCVHPTARRLLDVLDQALTSGARGSGLQ